MTSTAEHIGARRVPRLTRSKGVGALDDVGQPKGERHEKAHAGTVEASQETPCIEMVQSIGGY